MSKSHGLWAVVPVKLFARTKRRLMPLLARHERGALARAMLADVLSALARARCLAGIMVVTGDADAAAMARAAGALVLIDAENAGTTAAVTKAAAHLAAAGNDGMLVIPADVPLLTPADIETIVTAHRAAPSVTLVPASFDGGTNALAYSPPGAVPVCYGDNSFRQHREAAWSHGIEPQILQLEHLGNDIDRPDDLATFLLRPSPTQSHAYLTTNGIAERLRRAPWDRRDQLRAG
ncbi:MAG TPA: 2-phospho-L-lactate guanylyltransferase [Burkholderiales bacterium]|nr:2-phospho-L-lactate guanylyltransferase [Burkholderiales bacterium]